MGNVKIIIGIYCRVSSDKQVEEGLSLEWQKRILTEYANKNNLEIVDYYIEKGISGDNIKNRPEMKRLLNDIKTKKVNGVLAYKLDRIARKVIINSGIYKDLVSYKCLLYTYDKGLWNLETALDTLMYNIISAICQYEVDNLSERVINGKKERAKNGLYINSYNVYGYDNYIDYKGTRMLKVNQFESSIINEIYHNYLNGISINNIAKELNDRQIPTKRNGKWCPSTINQILKNKLYIGIVVYNGIAKTDCFETKGQHQAIIDDILFNQVAKLIEERKELKVKKLTKEYSFYSKVLVSKENGIYFIPKQTKSKDKNSIRYYCKDTSINMPSIKHLELEKMFALKLSNIHFKYDEKIIKSIFCTSDYDLITSLIEKLQRERDDLFVLYNEKVIVKDEFIERLKILDNKKDDLIQKQKISECRIGEYSEEIKQEVMKLLNKSLMVNYLQLSNQDKRNFINLFVDKIIIDKDHNIDVIWKRQ